MRQSKTEQLNTWLFHKPLRKALLLSVAFFILLFLLFHPRFDTNDDVRQAMIASGIGITDSPDSHILFPHIYLGQFLKAAYTQFPAFPWYGMMLYLALFAGVCMLVYALLKKEKSPWLWLLWAALPLSLNIQYTGVAFVLAMGALFLIKIQKRDKITPWILPGAALIVASMIRWEAFLLVTGLFGLGILVEKIGDWKSLFRQERTYMGHLLASVAVLGLTFLFHMAHISSYDNDSSWRDFRKQNALRAEITDYDHIPFDRKRAPFYVEIGWTASAFQLYQSWFLADREVLSIEKTAKLVQAQKWTWRWEAKRMRQRFLNLPRQNLFAGVLFIPLLFGFFLLDKKTKYKFLFLGFFTASLLLYLAFDQWLHNRISLPVMAFMLFWMHLHQSKKGLKSAKIALMGFSILYFSAYLYRDFQEKKRMEVAEKALHIMEPHAQKLFAIWADSFPYEYLFRPFAENRRLMEDISLLPLGMTVYTPFFDQKMQAHGFSNIHVALRDSQTLLVARPELLPAYQQFMKDYYDQETNFESIYAEKAISLYVWKLK